MASHDDCRGERIIFRVDRRDYTKGIPDRIRAFERLLGRHPEWRERVLFAQVGAPSRDHLARYRALSDEVDDTVKAATTPAAPAGGSRSSTSASIARRPTSRRCIGPMTCASCSRCTTA